MNSRPNTTLTTPAGDLGPGVPWQRLLLGVVLSGLVVVTVMGNVLVVVVVARNRRLQTVFNVFIVNLAVTDIAVAVTSMSFFVVYNVLQRWPFGMVMCGIWIFFDFSMSICSILTLVVISVDRYWAVHWSHHYRLHNSWQKAAIFIAAIWGGTLVMWVPAFVVDRINNSREGNCFFNPNRNKAFVLFLVIFGYLAVTTVMLVCYIKVYLFTRRLSKTSPLTGLGSFAADSNVSTTATSPVTTLVQMTSRRHSITPTLNATITAAPLMEMDEKVTSQVDVYSEETASTNMVENVVDVDQESTCSTMSLLATMDTAQDLVGLTKFLKPTVGTVQSSTCPTKSPQPTLGTAKDSTCLPKSLQPTVGTAKDSTCLPMSPQPTVGTAKDSTCLPTSPQPTVGTVKDSTCLTKSPQPTVGTVKDSTCLTKSLQATMDTVKALSRPTKSPQETVRTVKGLARPTKSFQSEVGTIQGSSSPAKSPLSAVDTPHTSTCPAKSPLSTADTPHTSTCPANSFQPSGSVAQKPASPTTEADDNKTGQFGLSHKAIGPEVAKPVHDAGVTTAYLIKRDKEDQSQADGTSERTLTVSAREAVVGVGKTRFTAETEKDETSQPGKSRRAMRRSTASQAAYPQTSPKRTMQYERKVFVTVTCILVGYLVCLLPNHITFNIMAIDISLVPKWWRNLTYWLMYCNSTINPFLYNFANPEFRRAFREILSCRRASRHEWQQ